MFMVIVCYSVYYCFWISWNIFYFVLGSAYSWGFGDNHQLGHGNDEDQYTPKLIEGNFLNSWKALKIAGGGQHTLILAQPRNSSGESQ